MVRNAGKCPPTPLWKLSPPGLFWPKIGHWEKMRYLFKMISTRPFPIDLALIHPRHNPEGPWHPPDTHQTPNRHLTDSLKCMFFGRKQRKSTSWILFIIQLFWTSVTNILPIHLPDEERHHPDTLKHPPDTPKFSTFWLWRKGNSLIWQLLLNCLWFIWHLYSPRHLSHTTRYDPDTHRHHLDTLQTQSRHPQS